MELLITIVTALQLLFLPTNNVKEIDVPILMYHHIEQDENKLNEFMVTPDKFKSDMQIINKLGYETISYGELYDFVYNNGNLPEKPIIITFDDGYESNYIYAYPVLKKYNMKATIAVVGIMVGKSTYNGNDSFKHFTYEQAKEMYNSGLIDIQSHTYNMHDIKYRVGIKRKNNENENKYIDSVKNDIKISMREIEENVGNKQIVFTYPYGAYDILTEKILSELGYKITVTTDPGVNHVVKEDGESLLKLKRYDIKNNTNLRELLDIL